MKLTDLLKEQGSPDENDIIDQLELALKRWEEDKTPPYDRLDSCERSDQYHEDIKDIVDDYEEESGADAIAMGADDVRDMEEQEETEGRITKIKLKMSNIKDEVTIDQKYPSCFDSGDKCLDDVTISWGNESHTVSFEFEGMIEDHGNKGSETEFMADSDDGKWQFILDVSAAKGIEDGSCNPCIQDYDWDELIIQDHPEDESHLDPEDRFDQDPMEEDVDEGTCGYGKDGKIGKKPAGPDMLQERFQKLAGIKK
jgi:hypothetical protein